MVLACRPVRSRHKFQDVILSEPGSPTTVVVAVDGVEERRVLRSHPRIGSEATVDRHDYAIDKTGSRLAGQPQ